jgi:tetratricopeptide (TPR) repeat protein
VALQADLKKAENRLLKDHNYVLAIGEFERIFSAAQRDNMQELAVQAAASKSWAAFQKAMDSDRAQDNQAALEHFNSAFALTQEGKYREIAAKVLAGKAIYLLNTQKSPGDLLNARRLLTEASRFSETQPEVRVGVSILFEKIGDLSMSQKMVDQALISSPSNWQALSQRYSLARKLGKTADQSMVATLLKHYWPGVALPAETGLTKPGLTKPGSTRLPAGNKTTPGKTPSQQLKRTSTNERKSERNR